MSDLAVAQPAVRPRTLADTLQSSLLPPADLCLGIALACAWAMGHAFVGIDGDSRIYMGRVLADLDPTGVGLDPMFAMDGQSGFSIYRLLARWLATHAGFGATVAILSILNLAAWAAAIVAVARTFVSGRAITVVLAAIVVLPRLYTPWNLLAAGEAIAVPRPLAEAGVLLAMAALVRGRWIACAACLFVAALFHPIMAAPGFGVLLIALGIRDRRWFAAAAALALAALVAGLLGLPLASRLTARIDPDWMRLLVQRNPYLFLHLWTLEGLSPILVEAVTLAIGSAWLRPPAGIVVLAALAVAALGLLASYVGGDLIGSQLLLQAQLWRALWLPAVLAPVLAGLCLVHLPRRGPTGQIALASLSLAWIASGDAGVQAAAALLAVTMVVAGPRFLPSVGRPVVVAAWVACAAFAVHSQTESIAVLRVLLARLPDGAALPAAKVWPLGFAAIPLMGLAYAVWRRPRAAGTRLAAGFVALAGLATVAVWWDGRTQAQGDIDTAAVKPDLVARLASRPGAVLWADGDDGWYWARRPNWNGMTQGGGLVFSRDLAMLWHARGEAMVAAGLANENFLRPWDAKVSLDALTLDAAAIGAFCRRPDAPAWIVASLEPGAMPPTSLGATVWSPSHAHLKLFIGADDVRWRRFDRYAIVPCAPPLAKSAAG